MLVIFIVVSRCMDSGMSSHISLKYVNEFLRVFWNALPDLSEIRCKSLTEHLWFSWKSVRQRLYFSNGRKWIYIDAYFAKLYGILKVKLALVKSVDYVKKLTLCNLSVFATQSAGLSLFFMESRHVHFHSVRKVSC